MHYDPVKRAYVDNDTGEVVYQEEQGLELTDVYISDTPPGQTTNSSYTATVARPQKYAPLSTQRSSTIAPSPESNVVDLEQQLYDMHVSGADVVEPTIESPSDRSVWDDWSLARTLQSLEFEIPNEAVNGGWLNQSLSASAAKYTLSVP